MEVCTFLYTGDYETSQPTLRVDVSPFTAEDKAEGEGLKIEAKLDVGLDTEAQPDTEPQVMPEEAIFEVMPPAQSHHTESDTNLHNTLLDSFNIRHLTPINDIVRNETTIENGTTFDMTKYPYAQYCYVDILIGHAKLYVFAKYHLYPTLTNCALQRLIKTLDNVRCEEEHAAREVAALADFVYEHVGGEGVDEEPLRKAVSHFVAINFTSLERSNLETSLALGGDFTLDVLRKISRRLRAESELVDALKQENASLGRKAHNFTVVEEQPADPWGLAAAAAAADVEEDSFITFART